MSDSSAIQSDPLMTLHVISHLHWDREGYITFEISRARLLDTLTRLLEQMRQEEQDLTLKHFLLGGQTIILEDIAAVRPDLVTLLVIYNAGGRLGLGPWYVQVEETLVSGESLVRNLLLGRDDARPHGLKLMPVAYMPDSYGYAPQLPQILHGFGIDAAFIRYRKPVMTMPFRWEAPDGSSVLVVSYSDYERAADAIAAQKYSQPDGPFLWMHDSEHHSESLAPQLDESLSVPVRQSALNDYVQAIRQSLPDGMRPATQGELGAPGLVDQGTGRLSARLYLKQDHARLQSRLTYGVEPWLAIALTHGDVQFPDNLRALLNHNWRLLLKNQAHNNLSGCALDKVHDEMEVRSRHIEDLSARIAHNVLEALPGTPYDLRASAPTPTAASAPAGPSSPLEETYITVWNPHNWPVRQVVEVPVRLPGEAYPAALFAPDGEELIFGWAPGTATDGRLHFQADVPPVGYAVYTLKLSKSLPASHHLTRTIRGQVIGNEAGETLFVEGGRLVWNRDNKRLFDLLRFYDGGDAGDTRSYRPALEDVVVRASLVDKIEIEANPMYERLILQHRMRIAPSLNPDKTRVRGLRLLNLYTTVTFYDSMPGAYFQTKFMNSAQDHRLRVHLRTGIQTKTVSAAMAYGLVERAVKRGDTEIPATQPMHQLCVLEEGEQAMALVTDGLPEFEAIPEVGQVTLALTLLRSVGWIDRQTGVRAPGAQCDREIVARYAMLPVKPGNPVDWLRARQVYAAPLQAYQYREKPETLRHSYLTMDGDNAILMALKPPQEGNGWIVRLLNPTDESTRVVLTPHRALQYARLTNLAEEDQAEFEMDRGQVGVRLEPHQVASVRLSFS